MNDRAHVEALAVGRIRAHVTLLLIAALSGCASTGIHPWTPAIGAPARPVGGTALVRFHRPQGAADMSGRWHIWDGETLVGISTYQTVCLVDAEPGEHLFMAGRQRNALKATLEAGLGTS